MDIGSVSTLSYMTQATSQTAQRPAPPSEEDIGTMTDHLLSEKDSDGDGALSNDEFGISDDAFSAADTDGSGTLSRDEMIAGKDTIGKELAPMGPPPEMMGAGGPPESEEEEQSMSLDVLM